MFKVVSKYKQALHGLPCFVCGGKANVNLAFRKNALKMALGPELCPKGLFLFG
jgi:hypothetical protein